MKSLPLRPAGYLAVLFAWFNFAFSQTPSTMDSRTLIDKRPALEAKLSEERQRGKAAEDPSIQELENDVIASEYEAAAARQPQGLDKGPKLYLQLPVLYATNRKQVGESYSAEINPNNDVEYGIARLTVATNHGVRTDYLADASFTSKGTAPNNTSVISQFQNFEKFREVVKTEAYSGKNPRKILVFVHGFNTTFAQALERTALIASELQTPVVPIAYSWPSAGNIRGYSHDEEYVQASTEAFDSFLKLLIKESPSEIVIVCHSMGAREVTRSLSDIAKEKLDTKRLRNVVFVAADIFTSDFQSKWTNLTSLKNVKYSFYASDSDLPLLWSFFKHDAPRLGYVNSKLWLPPGGSTIDASSVDSIFNAFGHSYIENPQLGADIGNLITTGKEPTDRGLASHPATGGVLYYFP